jgi:hypothetical protein
MTSAVATRAIATARYVCRMSTSVFLSISRQGTGATGRGDIACFWLSIAFSHYPPSCSPDPDSHRRMRRMGARLKAIAGVNIQFRFSFEH